MGSTSYDSTFTASRLRAHRDAGTDSFVHDSAIKTGKIAAAVNPLLDPKVPNTVGQLIRESLDSDVHPESRAIGVLFDHTGSMGGVPRRFVNNLTKFMEMLVEKGYIKHPHIMFGSIGDATCDPGALQLGQFEGGNEMDSALANLWLVGRGGSQRTESYELAMYYMARHTKLDCLDKRGEKGYLFIIGDETPYPVIRASEVEELIGDGLQADILLSPNYDGWNRNSLQETYLENGVQKTRKIEGDLLAELQEKFEVFFIMPEEGSYADDTEVTSRLESLFGQNFRMLESADGVCELLCMLIGLNEGYDIKAISTDLKDSGSSDSSIRSASTALATYVPRTSTLATASGTLASSALDSVDRL